MNQRKEPFTKSGIYHIYNRGHNKQQIFLTYKDYSRYLKRLREYAQKHPITLLAYTLMPNHIHLLVRQDGDDSIDHFIHRLHTAYTMYFNKKYERVGSVFQGRFKAKNVGTDEYLLHVSRYIHLNPIEILRAQGRALSLEDYKWSSYKEYVNSSSSSSLTNPTFILEYFSSQLTRQLKTSNNKENTRDKYRKFVEDAIKLCSDDQLTDISNGNI